MTVTPASLQGLCPEFASELTSRLQSFIDQASRRVSQNVFADKYDDAVGLVAAHLVTVANRRGIGGSLTGRTVGPVSAQFSAPATVFSNYQTTSYGQEFLTLANLVRQTPAVA